MEPKVTQGSKEAGRNDLDGSQSRELHELVSKIINLPSEEFIPTLVALIRPPPVKQPLHLGEAVVIERKTLDPEETS